MTMLNQRYYFSRIRKSETAMELFNNLMNLQLFYLSKQSQFINRVKKGENQVTAAKSVLAETF